MFHLSVAAIVIKIFTDLFHDQQENFSGIRGKREERKKSEGSVLVLRV